MTVCDRCRATVKTREKDDSPTFERYIYRIEGGYELQRDTWEMRAQGDLCPQCAKALLVWIFSSAGARDPQSDSGYLGADLASAGATR